MPTVTFSTLQSRVQTRVIDLPSAVLSEVPSLINDAIHFICGAHNFRVMRAETDYTTANSTHILGTVPSDWKEPCENPYWLSSIGWAREITWLPTRAYVNRQWAPADPNANGPPANLLLGESESTDNPDPSNPDQDMSAINIEFYPYSDGQSDWPDGQYRLKIPYWRYLPDLSAGSDHNWFSDWGDQYLIGYATYQAFLLDWDEQRAGVWATQTFGPKWDGFTYSTLGGWARNLINRDKSIGFAPGRTLVPRRSVLAPRDQFRT